mgnify:CR=1 FL=1
MAAIRTGTSVKWGQIPLWFSSGYEMNNQQIAYSGNYLVSVNKPIVYQVMWDADAGTTPAINEMYVPALTGDVVNAIFKIYATTESPVPSSSLSLWDKVAEIKKSSDVPNTNIVDGAISNSQRFTIDVSRVLADQLSYSLVPIGKGSWENQEYGGMNGGTQKQDNITEAVSPYNVTRNGMFRSIRVTVAFETINSSGGISLSSTVLGISPTIRVINSVPSWNENTYNNQMRVVQQWSVETKSPKRALTNCPNVTPFTVETPEYFKSVNLSSLADYLYFYVKESYNGSDDTDYYNLYEVYGQCWNYGDAHNNPTGLSFVLGSNWKNSVTGTIEVSSDISHNFRKENATQFAHAQAQIAVQNISPAYINSHSYAPQNATYPYVTARTPITDNTDYYRVYVRGTYYSQVASAWKSVRHTSCYWYSINREDNSDIFEDKNLFQNITFHWLNTVGGIDTYTARRDRVESIVVNKSLMEKKLPSRFYFQDDAVTGGGTLGTGDYYNDGMRGYNTYQGGTEVLSVDAKTSYSAYTEPLAASESTWLREMFHSPNVWVEEATDFNNEVNYEADAPYLMNKMNPYLRPANVIYKPVIINNSEVVSLDEEKGLVMFNIEYTESQGIPTQRN